MKQLLPILALTALPFLATPVLADASNLRCNNGYHKVRTYTNAIKCKAARSGMPSRYYAGHLAAAKSLQASCNSHYNQPKIKVFPKRGKWAYRVTFTCAIIY